VVHLPGVDACVVETPRAGLGEQLADPRVALPEVGHRRADDSDVHCRVLAGAPRVCFGAGGVTPGRSRLRRCTRRAVRR
jgi:hypothetical protein